MPIAASVYQWRGHLTWPSSRSLLQQRPPSWLPAARPQQLALGTAAAAAAAAALTLGAAGPAAASSLLAHLGSSGDAAGAFIPGLLGDDPLREGFVSALLLIFFSGAPPFVRGADAAVCSAAGRLQAGAHVPQCRMARLARRG